MLSCLAFGWKWGWCWPRFDRNLTSFRSILRISMITTTTQQKGRGFCQNTFNSSAIFIQRPGIYAHNRSFFHSSSLVQRSVVFMWSHGGHFGGWRQTNSRHVGLQSGTELYFANVLPSQNGHRLVDWQLCSSLQLGCLFLNRDHVQEPWVRASFSPIGVVPQHRIRPSYFLTQFRAQKHVHPIKWL